MSGPYFGWISPKGGDVVLHTTVARGADPGRRSFRSPPPARPPYTGIPGDLRDQGAIL